MNVNSDVPNKSPRLLPSRSASSESIIKYNIIESQTRSPVSCQGTFFPQYERRPDSLDGDNQCDKSTNFGRTSPSNGSFGTRLSKNERGKQLRIDSPKSFGFRAENVLYPPTYNRALTPPSSQYNEWFPVDYSYSWASSRSTCTKCHQYTEVCQCNQRQPVRFCGCNNGIPPVSGYFENELLQQQIKPMAQSVPILPPIKQNRSRQLVYHPAVFDNISHLPTNIGAFAYNRPINYVSTPKKNRFKQYLSLLLP